MWIHSIPLFNGYHCATARLRFFCPSRTTVNQQLKPPSSHAQLQLSSSSSSTSSMCLSSRIWRASRRPERHWTERCCRFAAPGLYTVGESRARYLTCANIVFAIHVHSHRTLGLSGVSQSRCFLICEMCSTFFFSFKYICYAFLSVNN